MLDQKYLENNLEVVKEKVLQRGMELDSEGLLSLNSERKQIIVEVETLEHERNQGSKKVGELKRDGSNAEADEMSKKLKQMDLVMDRLLDNPDAAAFFSLDGNNSYSRTRSRQASPCIDPNTIFTRD